MNKIIIEAEDEVLSEIVDLVREKRGVKSVDYVK